MNKRNIIQLTLLSFFVLIACSNRNVKKEECDCLKDYKFMVNYVERNFSDDIKDAYKKGIEDLKSAKLNSFVKQGDDVTTFEMDKKLNPKRVAILYNKGCASSCETLLFLALKSEKTTLVGENSGGYVGYGNMFSITTPHYGITLSHTTTRYKTQKNYEVIGITPEYQLNYDEDWVQQTIKILKINN